jgi:hypothetical protein
MLTKLNEMDDAWGFHDHGKKLINLLDNSIVFVIRDKDSSFFKHIGQMYNKTFDQHGLKLKDM